MEQWTARHLVIPARVTRSAHGLLGPIDQAKAARVSAQPCWCLNEQAKTNDNKQESEGVVRQLAHGILDHHYDRRQPQARAVRGRRAPNAIHELAEEDAEALRKQRGGMRQAPAVELPFTFIIS